jgi:DNA topoisomerase-1
MALVAAQEGRRVLDRFCGYMVSGPISNAAGEKLSVGRVQSPAVRLVEREKEIKAFSSTTHYGAELTFENVDNITDGWKAVFLVKPWIEEGQEYLLDKSLAEKAAALRTLDVLDCKESERRAAPPAPFTTSTLQQAASSSLKFTPKQTMQLAQRLYEQGAITYMRTDSPNLSQEAVHAIRAYCETKGWPLVETPRKWKSKEGAQEAHEAIRPTHIEIEEAGETADEKALYRLIRLRSPGLPIGRCGLCGSDAPAWRGYGRKTGSI